MRSRQSDIARDRIALPGQRLLHRLRVRPHGQDERHAAAGVRDHQQPRQQRRPPERKLHDLREKQQRRRNADEAAGGAATEDICA